MKWVFHAYSEMYGVALMGSRHRAAPLNPERRRDAEPAGEAPRPDRRRLGILGTLVLGFFPRNGRTVGQPRRR